MFTFNIYNKFILLSLGLLLKIVLPLRFQNFILKWNYSLKFPKQPIKNQVNSHKLIKCVLLNVLWMKCNMFFPPSIVVYFFSQYAWKTIQKNLVHLLLQTSPIITPTAGSALTGSQWEPPIRLHCISRTSPWRRKLVEHA